MKKLLAQNGLALLSSNRTRTHTAFYVAEKRGPGHEERATDRWE